MLADERVVALAEGRAAVVAALSDLTAQQASQRPPDGGWNAWEIAYHVFDIERWYIAKLCEAAAPDRAAALDRFVAVWSRLRDESIRLVDEIPPQRLGQAGLLSGVPEWTPAGLIAAMAAHDREHAEQALAARRAAPAPCPDSG